MKNYFNPLLLLFCCSSVVLLISCNNKRSNPSKEAINLINLKRGDVVVCGPPESQLGSVDFEMSCDDKVKKDFNLAIELLHSFEYDESSQSPSQSQTLQYNNRLNTLTPSTSSSTSSTSSTSTPTTSSSSTSSTTLRERDRIIENSLFPRESDYGVSSTADRAVTLFQHLVGVGGYQPDLECYELLVRAFEVSVRDVFCFYF